MQASFYAYHYKSRKKPCPYHYHKYRRNYAGVHGVISPAL